MRNRLARDVAIFAPRPVFASLSALERYKSDAITKDERHYTRQQVAPASLSYLNDVRSTAAGPIIPQTFAIASPNWQLQEGKRGGERLATNIFKFVLDTIKIEVKVYLVPISRSVTHTWKK